MLTMRKGTPEEWRQYLSKPYSEPWGYPWLGCSCIFLCFVQIESFSFLMLKSPKRTSNFMYSIAVQAFYFLSFRNCKKSMYINHLSNVVFRFLLLSFNLFVLCFKLRHWIYTELISPFLLCVDFFFLCFIEN